MSPGYRAAAHPASAARGSASPWVSSSQCGGEQSWGGAGATSAPCHLVLGASLPARDEEEEKTSVLVLLGCLRLEVRLHTHPPSSETPQCQLQGAKLCPSYRLSAFPGR